MENIPTNLNPHNDSNHFELIDKKVIETVAKISEDYDSSSEEESEQQIYDKSAIFCK